MTIPLKEACLAAFLVSVLPGCEQDGNKTDMPRYSDYFNDQVYYDLVTVDQSPFMTVNDDAYSCRWPIDDLDSGVVDCSRNSGGANFTLHMDASDKAKAMLGAYKAERKISNGARAGLVDMYQRCMPYLGSDAEETPFYGVPKEAGHQVINRANIDLHYSF